MSNYKKGFNDFFSFIKNNKIVLLFAFLTSFGGILFVGNVITNFIYFKNHIYNITLSSDFSVFLETIRAFFYNNIIQGSAESLAFTSKIADVYRTTKNVLSLEEFTNNLNLIILILCVFVFFIVNISSYFLILLDIKIKDKSALRSIKDSFLKTLPFELLKIFFLSFVFVIIALIAVLFKINSIFYIFVSFFIAGFILYLTFFVYHFSIRSLLLLNCKIKKALFLSFSFLKKNFFTILKTFFVLFFNIIISFFIILIIVFPLLLLNSYFISIGYNVFNLINFIFLILISLISFSFINLLIYRSLNILYLKVANLEK